MICDLSAKICEAHCCAALQAGEYVKKASKGRATEQDFYTLIILNQYLNSLDGYKKSLSLGGGCTGCGHGGGTSCLTEAEVKLILEQVSSICGGCSCNCN